MKVNPANPLLARDYVGGSKPTTRDLPGSHFSYGKPDIKDPEGVAEGNSYFISLYLLFIFRYCIQV